MFSKSLFSLLALLCWTWLHLVRSQSTKTRPPHGWLAVVPCQSISQQETHTFSFLKEALNRGLNMLSSCGTRWKSSHTELLHLNHRWKSGFWKWVVIHTPVWCSSDTFLSNEARAIQGCLGSRKKTKKKQPFNKTLLLESQTRSARHQLQRISSSGLMEGWGGTADVGQGHGTHLRQRKFPSYASEWRACFPLFLFLLDSIGEIRQRGDSFFSWFPATRCFSQPT